MSSTPASEPGSNPSISTVSTNLRERLTSPASSQLKKRSPATNPQDLQDLLNICRETVRNLGNLIKEAYPDNSTANEPVEDPEHQEVTVEEKEEEHDEVE